MTRLFTTICSPLFFCIALAASPACESLGSHGELPRVAEQGQARPNGLTDDAGAQAATADRHWATVREAADMASDANQHAAAVFAREPEVRIVFNEGGGHGNQRASLTVIERLEKIGFRGHYFILAANGTLERALSLIRDFFSAHPELDQKRFSYEVKAGKHVRYAMTGALDTPKPGMNQLASADQLIVIQPTDWNSGPGYHVIDGPGEMQANYGPPLNANGRSDMALACLCSLPEEKIDDVFERSKLGSGDNKYLRELVDRMMRRAIDVQVVYGLHNETTPGAILAIDMLSRLLGAYHRLRVTGALPRPVVVLVMSNDFNPQPLSARFPHLVTLHGGVPEPSALKPDDVKLAVIPMLPFPVFDALLQWTSLPPLVEGANSRNVIKETRHTGFMQAVRLKGTEDSSQATAQAASPKGHALFIAAQNGLAASPGSQSGMTEDDAMTAVADFLRAYVSNAPELHTYFETWFEHFRNRPDTFLAATAAIAVPR